MNNSIQGYIDWLKLNYSLDKYQEEMIQRFLEYKGPTPMSVIFNPQTKVLLKGYRDPDSLKNLEKKLRDGLSPMQIVIDELP